MPDETQMERLVRAIETLNELDIRHRDSLASLDRHVQVLFSRMQEVEADVRDLLAKTPGKVA